MPRATCPECGYVVQVSGKPYIGQQVTCEECGARLEVVDLNPLELDWALEEPFDEEEDEAP